MRPRRSRAVGRVAEALSKVCLFVGGISVIAVVVGTIGAITSDGQLPWLYAIVVVVAYVLWSFFANVAMRVGGMEGYFRASGRDELADQVESPQP